MKLFLKVLAFILHGLFALTCFGGPHERVAVAEAIVWANQNARPSLPHDVYQGLPNGASPTPLTAAELAKKQDEQIREMIQEVNDCRESLNAANHRIAQLKIASGSVDRSQLSPSASQVPIAGAGGILPMRLEIPANAVPVEIRPLECVTHTLPSCTPCRRMKKQNGDGDERIKITYTDDPVPGLQDYFSPCTTFTDSQGKPRYIAGIKTVDELVDIIERTNGIDRIVQSGSGSGAPAGTIHAGEQIRKAVNYLRQYIGEGNRLTVIWDRSEARLNLFAAKEFTLKDLIGRQGRLQVDAPNAIGLPVKSMATSYDLIGDRIFLDPERFGLELSLFNPSKGYGAQPAQFMVLDDMLLIYSVCQMCYAIYELMHPSADLVLPDQIVTSVILNGDTINVDFEKPPQVCLTWLFTFNLAVKHVTISDSLVHVDFTGSRFIKSREFAVK